jgi:hypothetical protein
VVRAAERGFTAARCLNNFSLANPLEAKVLLYIRV